VLDVQPDGLLDLAVLKAALRPDTMLVSVMLVNNEIGVIQDIAASARCAAPRRAAARGRGAGQRQGGHRPGRCRST
jgi:cysteine sulfinate desulfinase/cysteine desulfurase-like protein